MQWWRFGEEVDGFDPVPAGGERRLTALPPKSWLVMFTTALWFSILLVSRVLAGILVRSGSSNRLTRPPAHSSVRFQTSILPNRNATPLSISCVAAAHPAEYEAHRISRSVQEQQGRNTVFDCPRAARPLQREPLGLKQSVSILPCSRPDVADCDHQQPLKSVHPLALGAPPSVSFSSALLTTFLDSNVAFYNLLSACAWFCIKQPVDPFYKWADSCNQAVPMTRDYPFTTVITTVIPPWASKKLSSGGNFDPSAVMPCEFPCLPPFPPSGVRPFRSSPHKLLTDPPWQLRQQGNGLLCRRLLLSLLVRLFWSSSAWLGGSIASTDGVDPLGGRRTCTRGPMVTAGADPRVRTPPRAISTP